MEAKTKFDTSKTDKATFKISVIDTPKYDKLSKDEKELFEILRNSVLEILPVDDKGNYFDTCIQFAENSAFNQLTVFTVKVNAMIDKKISDFEKNIKTYITETTKTYDEKIAKLSVVSVGPTATA